MKGRLSSRARRRVIVIMRKTDRREKGERESDRMKEEVDERARKKISLENVSQK
jgi:hypothetical protein